MTGVSVSRFTKMWKTENGNAKKTVSQTVNYKQNETVFGFSFPLTFSCEKGKGNLEKKISFE